MALKFLEGKFVDVPDVSSDTMSNTIPDSRSDDILDVLARVQRDLNAANTDKRKALESFNQARLMTFPEIPSESKSRVQFVIVDELKKEGGLARVESYIKYWREICSLGSNLVEDFRSKASIKISATAKSERAFKEVAEQRSSPKPHKGPNKFTPEEKIIANFWKSSRKNASYRIGVTQLVRVVQAVNPSISETVIRAFVDKMNAREQSGDTKKP